MELRVLQYSALDFARVMKEHPSAAAWAIGEVLGVIFVLQCREGATHDAPWLDVPMFAVPMRTTEETAAVLDSSLR